MRALAAVLAALSLLTFASCGGAGKPGSNRGGAKDAERIVASMAAALNEVRSYHVEGTQTDAEGTARVEGDVTAAGSARVRTIAGSRRIEFVISGRRAYVKATQSFWLKYGHLPGRLARRLASRWVKTPPGSGLAESMQSLLPKNIGYCATRGHGKLTNAGTRRLARKPVIVLTDDGAHVGDAPGRLYISATGRPLPVRAVQTGPRRAGDTDPRCGGGQRSSITASDLRFSDYDKPVTISPPAGAVDAKSLVGGAVA